MEAHQVLVSMSATTCCTSERRQPAREREMVESLNAEHKRMARAFEIDIDLVSPLSQ